jgi:hypothetical protein
MALSKTNTDELCYDSSPEKKNGWVRLAVYRFNLWTGLYMLERHERYAFNLVAGTFVAAAMLYCGSFTAGLLKGLFSM